MRSSSKLSRAGLNAGGRHCHRGGGRFAGEIGRFSHPLCQGRGCRGLGGQRLPDRGIVSPVPATSRAAATFRRGLVPFPKASRALERFTVLDLTRVRSGPTCVRQLADWGANVIKIEMPPEPQEGEPLGGPREGPDFQNLHRNKRSMTLNLKKPEGAAALNRMVT